MKKQLSNLGKKIKQSNKHKANHKFVKDVINEEKKIIKHMGWD